MENNPDALERMNDKRNMVCGYDGALFGPRKKHSTETQSDEAWSQMKEASHKKPCYIRPLI